MLVGIAGGGIGGLALAQGLRRRGIDTVVFERDARAGDTAGYRLHLPHQALVVLRELLPGPLVTAIEGTAAAPETLRQIAVLDHRGRTRARIPLPAEQRLLIGRRPLRELLARGLGDVVRWGTRVISVRETAGAVLVGLDHGPDVEVDVLVGADGTRSRVTRHVTGRPAARPSGIVAIGGTATGPVRRPADLRSGIALAGGPRGIGVFLAAHEPRGGAPAPGAIVEQPYVVWSVAAPVARFSGDVTVMSPAALLREAREMLAGWSPGYRELVDGTPPESVAAFPFVFPGALRPWRSARVTLLGDAVHPMPPTAGEGASTALLDAGHLAGDLAAGEVPAALQRYQRRLLEYAPAAVREATPALDWQRRLGNPVLRALVMEVGMPVANATLRLFRP
jgi:2-polyprenyl-6-methoxyphenol hydroxylase-like FAD-dependent oxidoreductase